MTTISVLVIGIVLFLAFTLLKLLYRRSSGQYRWARNAGEFLPYVEFVVWVVYYFWAVDRLFFAKSYYSILLISSVIILLVLFSWFYFKNLLAGIIFRMQHQPQPGQHIMFDNFAGTIKDVGNSYLSLETADGDELKVPYAHLFGPIFESSRQKSKEKKTIKVRVAKTGSAETITEKIRTVILNSPWSTFKKEPLIKLISQDADHYEFEISLNTLAQGHISKVEEALKDEI